MKMNIRNSGALRGEIAAGGAKNAALPILAASILCGGVSEIHNIPCLTDTENMKEIMRRLGVKTDGCRFDSSNIERYDATCDEVKKLRGSFLLCAPLLVRCKKAYLPLPGGCPIGTRPVDLHLKGFRALGAEIETGHGFVEISCKKLHGEKVYLDFPSVGATENIITAAAAAEGETVIENAAAEPEVKDLCDFLNKQGAKIYGGGSNTVNIVGTNRLSGCTHRIIPDRIEAGTYLAAFAVTHGRGRVKNVRQEHQKPLIAKLREMGARIYEDGEDILIDADCELESVDIKTLPYPGFPTDMQAQFMSLLTMARGTGIVTETVFENRFLHIGELLRMGADIKTDGRTAVVEGVGRLTGAQVTARDLRGGAALAIAGICAEGETQICGAELIMRGYEGFAEKLRGIGAQIDLINE